MRIVRLCLPLLLAAGLVGCSDSGTSTPEVGPPPDDPPGIADTSDVGGPVEPPE